MKLGMYVLTAETAFCRGQSMLNVTVVAAKLC